MPTNFRIGPWLIQPSLNTIANNGTRVRLEPKVLNVLVYLAEHRGEVVSKDELMRAVWSDACVTDDTLTRAIYELRKVLQDDTKQPRFIQTIPRRGYRLIASIDSQQEPPAVEAEVDRHQQVDPMQEKSDRPGTSTAVALLNAGAASRKPLYMWAVLVGILLLASLIAVSSRQSHLARQRDLTRITFDAGLQTGATWSPDGRFIAYSSNRDGKFDIWVQPISGGDAVKITRGAGQNWQPEWSPDGKYIAYRSEDGTGGLYLVPVLGGARRKISGFGHYPRWSPDSSQIVFLPTTYGTVRSLYVVSLDGGQPQEILSEFFANHPDVRGRSATWHPDGRRISVYTWDYEKMAPVFWTVPLKSGEGLKTEVDPGLLRRMGGISSGRFVGDARFSWAPSGDTIYFECTAGGATNLWKIAVDQNTLRGSGIERLTTGSGHDAGVAVTPDGKKIAFSGESRQIQVWAAPFDPRSGKLSGKGELVTSPGIEAWTLSLAPHGERLAFSGNRGGSSQIWDESLVSGQVSLVIGDDAYARLHPLWSPDGTRLAYLRMKVHGSENKIVVWSSDSKEEQAITDGGEYDVYGWSHDGRELVVSKWSEKTKKAEVWLLSLSSGLCTEQIAASPDYHLFQGQFSPDGRWVAFEAVRDVPNGRESTIYVVPAHGGAWIRVTDGRQWDDKPRWSPDGRRLYFISAHGGFYNIWGNRFDPANGRVVGNPFQVTEFDNPALMVPIYIPDVGMSIAQGRLAVTVSQSSGSIWVLNNVDD